MFCLEFLLLILYVGCDLRGEAMKETKESRKKQDQDKKCAEEQGFAYIDSLDIEEDFQALDIAGEAYQAY